jgi:hypothetical protein
MIYYQVTIQIKRGKLNEWVARFEKEMLPITERHGQKLAAAWSTSIGAYDEVTHVYAFENLAELERIRQEVAKDPDRIKMLAMPQPNVSLIDFETSKVMTPLPYSPLK